MSQKTPLIVGNWKLNPRTREEAKHLVAAVARQQKSVATVDLVVVPSFVHLDAVGKRLGARPIALGAQDVYTTQQGAFTGEVAATQLVDLGVSYVIIGHSERRAMGETDEDVVAKTLAALQHRLTPIICFGETARDENGSFYAAIETQLEALASGLGAAKLKRCVLAYEPVWAIGTGETATPADVKEMQLFTESFFTKQFDRRLARSLRLLYGGSVKPHNAGELHAAGGMQGFLVGGASLVAADFIGIARAVIN
ncbi:MAG: triose-phosphate isomerase [Patescibacteria group bacterium]